MTSTSAFSGAINNNLNRLLSPGVQSPDRIPEGFDMKGYIEQSVPDRNYIEAIASMLLKTAYGTLIGLNGNYFIVIDNKDPITQVVHFEEFLAYGYKHVITDGVERIIDRQVWENLFQQKGPDNVIAISTASIIGKPLENAYTLLTEMVIRLKAFKYQGDKTSYLIKSLAYQAINNAPYPYMEAPDIRITPENVSNTITA